MSFYILFVYAYASKNKQTTKKEYICSTSMEENFWQRKTNEYTLFNL